MTIKVEKCPRVGDEPIVRAALESADPSVLWITLYQLTRDPELGRMRTVERLIRGGAMAGRALPEEHHALVREKALQFLMNPPTELRPPTESETKMLIELHDGAPVSAEELQFSVEELAFDDFSRPVDWTAGRPDEKLKDFHVVVVGAGISGICAAIYLERLGIPYTVVERQLGVGGTWELNDYPEARVDLPSFIYQFKFEKNYPWKHTYPPQEETLEYLRHVVDKYEVGDHIELGVEVTAAAWDESGARWNVTARSVSGETRTISADVLVSASGLFSTPKLPDISGIETFQGAMFHTTNWDHSYDYAGKRVAQIGTGSTGSQLMPGIARVAEKHTVFQRSRHWVTPIQGYHDEVGPEARWLFDNVPYYWNWFGYAAYGATRRFQDQQEIDYDWQKRGGHISPLNDKLRESLVAYAHEKFAGRPDLIEKVVPTYAPLAKRTVVDNRYFEALTRENVELVTCGIDRITPTGILDRDGVEHPADFIILAAGFEVSKYLWPVQYVGRDGITLEKAWEKDGARAYLGMTMPGFPNFFMYYGPNAQVRIGALHSWIEIWSRYIMSSIVGMIEGDHRTMEVRRPVFEDYNARLDAAYEGLIWQTEAPESYYVNEHGRGGVSVPFRSDEYYAMVRAVDFGDYTFS